MGWLIALGVILLLLITPLGISVLYDADGPRAHMLIGFVKLTLYPRKRKEKPKKNQKKSKKKSASGTEKAKAKEKRGGSLTDFFPLLRVILDFLVEFRRKIRVNHLVLRISLAGGDPCDLAANYGRVWAILSGLMPQLERFFIIKNRDVGVACDFLSDKTRILARLDLTITVGRLLSLGLRHGLHGFMEFQKIMNKRKGGVQS